jgi:hypothetical protein
MGLARIHGKIIGFSGNQDFRDCSFFPKVSVLGVTHAGAIMPF